MKHGDKLLLQIPAHIDQEVAATDEVELGKGRVLDHILLGNDQHIPDPFVDAIGIPARFRHKKAREPFR